jgi:hypothetical protein
MLTQRQAARQLHCATPAKADRHRPGRSSVTRTSKLCGGRAIFRPPDGILKIGGGGRHPDLLQPPSLEIVRALSHRPKIFPDRFFAAASPIFLEFLSEVSFRFFRRTVVDFGRNDMVPHVAARKTHQRLLKFSFLIPKRLLQHYRHQTDMPHWSLHVRSWG